MTGRAVEPFKGKGDRLFGSIDGDPIGEACGAMCRALSSSMAILNEYYKDCWRERGEKMEIGRKRNVSYGNKSEGRTRAHFKERPERSRGPVTTETKDILLL